MPSVGPPTAALHLSQSQAQWDAIASIKSTSPFAAAPASTGTSIAAALDAMLPGYGTAGALASGAAQDSQAQITARVQAAQQSTIDLFA